MSERMAPVDKRGTPYAPYPRDIYATGPVDEHHPQYLSTARALTTGYGPVVRMAMTYDIDEIEHDEFHHEHMGGVERYLKKPGEQFGYVIDTCARYLARTAVYIPKQGPPTLEPLPDAEYAFLRSRMHPEKNPPYFRHDMTTAVAMAKVRNFFTDYVIESSLYGVDKPLRERFMRANGEYRRITGRKVMASAIKIATSPFERRYKEALDDGLLQTDYSTAAALVQDIHVKRSWDDLQFQLRKARDEKAA